MGKRVFITGASGLLGTALVKKFSESGFDVLAHYYSRITFEHPNCRWIRGDFSTLDSIRGFLVDHKSEMVSCGYLINNYGPIISKSIPDLTGEDFYSDYHDNVITPFEITSFMLKYGGVKAVINIGFEYMGEIRPFKKILTYAAAKNALFLLTVSFSREYPGVEFKMFGPPTLEGAVVKRPDVSPVNPGMVAGEIFDLLNDPENK